MSNKNSIDEKLKYMEHEIVSQYPDGVNTDDLAKNMCEMCEKISTELIEDLRELITDIIVDMAIYVNTSYDFKNKTFILNFGIDDVDDVALLELKEILFFKLTYQMGIKKSIVSALMYTLIQNKSGFNSKRRIVKQEGNCLVVNFRK